MDTTIFNSTVMNFYGAQYMDMMTAGLVLMATIALFAIAASYIFAGICKRVR